MSERSSFVTEYIYNDDDADIVYEAMKNALGESNVFRVTNVIGGFVHLTGACGCDWLEFVPIIEKIKTKWEVKFVLIQDYEATVLQFIKQPDGNVVDENGVDVWEWE